MRRILVALAAVMFGVPISFAATPTNAAGPVLAFSGTRIQASGIVPGGKAVIYGIAALRFNDSNVIGRWSQSVTDDDHDGVVVFDLKKPLPATGLWIVIDLTNEHYSIASPLYSVPVARPQANSFRRSPKNILDTFDFNYTSLDLLYVEHGRGVWKVRAIDNDRYDRDTQRERTAVSLEDAELIEGSLDRAPADKDKVKEFTSAGLLFAIDWETMNVLTLRITPADLGGAQ